MKKLQTTALCLLLNSLFLSIEAKRRDIAILRTLGLTRGGVWRRVLAEAQLLHPEQISGTSHHRNHVKCIA